MAVFNGSRYVRKAIESILKQSFSNFELIIINDCSTDETDSIIRSFSDPRIRVLTNSKNLGLPLTLNRGLKESRYEYIARMDVDDISHPERLDKQVDFLDAHPGTGICGTWIQLFEDGKEEAIRYPTDSASIKSSLLFSSSIAHASIMARRDIILQNKLAYSNDYPCAEDYELWVRCSKVTEFYNIPEVLYYYRLHPGQETQKNAGRKTVSTEKVRLNQIRDLGINPTDEELSLHSSLARFSYVSTWCFVEKSRSWLHKLYYANLQVRSYPEEAFDRMLADRWFDICYNARNLGFWTFIQFMKSPLQKHTSLKSLAKLKFGLKSLMRV